MQVRNIRWVGVATERYDDMIRFATEVLGLPAGFRDATTAEFTTEEGDAFQVMGPGDPYFAFFRQYASGPVPLFEVDDVAAAREELEAAGVEVVGPPGQDATWDWVHLRAPDGHLYELASRRRQA